MALLKSTQVFDDAKAASLDTILAALTPTTEAGSVVFPGGTILKWGSIPALASIPANTSSTETLVFPAPFPTACEYFGALVTPAITSDFYGVTSLATKSASQVQYTIRNGATAQTVTGGVWVAIGK